MPDEFKTPITASVLLSIKLQLDFRKYDHVMFWEACCLAFFGFLRCSEFTVHSAGFQSDVHLTPGDILVNKKPFPDSLVVKLKKSKTDQFRRGFSVVLARSDSRLCPVCALLTYLQLRGPSQGPLSQICPVCALLTYLHLRGPSQGPLSQICPVCALLTYLHLRGPSQGPLSQICPISALLTFLHLRGPSQGPLFLFQNGSLLTQDKFSKLVRETVLAAGWSGNFTSHSFRVGAASTAASLGAPDDLIKALGRWNSDAYLLYVKLSRQQMSTVSRLMALSEPFSPGM